MLELANADSNGYYSIIGMCERKEFYSAVVYTKRC